MVDATSEEILASANRVKKQEVEDKEAGIKEAQNKIDKEQKTLLIGQIKKVIDKLGENPSMSLIKGKLQGVTDAPEEAINELIQKTLKTMRNSLMLSTNRKPRMATQNLKAGGVVKPKKKSVAGRLAKRGYGAARK